MMWGYRAPPKQHDRATLTDKPRNNLHNAPKTPATTPPDPTTPHTCGRAPGQSAGRAPFPTNRHEGGSLT